jgi:hypothetical protein
MPDIQNFPWALPVLSCTCKIPINKGRFGRHNHTRVVNTYMIVGLNFGNQGVIVGFSLVYTK